MLNVYIILPNHNGPENLKKSRQKNSWNQIRIIFFREIAFLAVFPGAKIDFWPFFKLQKWNLVKKIFFVKLMYLISRVFFWLGLVLIFWPTTVIKDSKYLPYNLRNACHNKIHFRLEDHNKGVHHKPVPLLHPKYEQMSAKTLPVLHHHRI